jgi:hypothetical protein
MAVFTIRVELPGNPTIQQYEALHREMASLGFIRTVLSDNQKQVNLRSWLEHERAEVPN